MIWSIVIAPAAMKMLAAIADRCEREAVAARIDHLADAPDKQGNPLTGELAGLRSIRAAGQRYRIIYPLDGGRVSVLVVAVGRRKQGDKADIYNLAKKLLRARLLD